MTREDQWQIGRRFGQWRRQRGLKQTQVAEAVGVCKETVSRIERGIVPLSALAMCRLYGRYGVQPHELVPREMWT